MTNRAELIAATAASDSCHSRGFGGLPAVLVTLSTGNYTAKISGIERRQSGVALVEVYEVP